MGEFMGRQTSDNQKHLNNTRGRNKSRQKPAVPKQPPISATPPAHLTQDQKKIWREYVEIFPPGTAMKGDQVALELLVRLTEDIRLHFDITPAARMQQLVQMLGKFGMTPADRNKILYEPPATENSFSVVDIETSKGKK